MRKFKLLYTILGMGFLGVSAFLVFTTAAAANGCDLTVSAGGDIQAAITTATSGDVICLESGIYSPSSTITINKSVSIYGPQAGIDPRPSAGSARVPGDSLSEAIIEGATNGLGRIIKVEADNVVINGVEVKSGTGDMIRQSSAYAGTVVQYSIIHDGNGDEGVQLKRCTDCVLEYNYVFDIANPGDALNISEGSNNGLIQFNEVNDIGSENAAIYVYDSTNTTIACNLVYDVTVNDGIKLGSKDGGDTGLAGGDILYNVVHDTAQDGISVYTSSTLVEGNEIYSSSSENGAIYVAFGVSDITITLNYVHNNALDTRKWGDPGGVMIGTAVNAATVRVFNNNILRNLPNGVTNEANGQLDAEDNWWGAVDGPSGVGTGSGDAVSTNVDFDPWSNEAWDIPNPCGPQFIEVDIDIKPGSFPNSINTKSKGKIPVAILSSPDFDVTLLNKGSLTFGRTGDEASLAKCPKSYEDVNDDGLDDLVCQFYTQQTGFQVGDIEGVLKGELLDGTPIEGRDSVRILK